jgi:hypothetical protein
VHADPTACRATAEMARGRSHHTATLLADGQVIVMGGDGPSGAPIDSVERFDPSTETWSELPGLPEPRSNHTTTLLEDGRLLVVGGAHSNQNGSPSPEGVLSTALLYDLARGVVAEPACSAARRHQAFRPSGGVPTPRQQHEVAQCTSVPDRQYGAVATVERFDVASELAAEAEPPGAHAFGAVEIEGGAPFLVGGARHSQLVTRRALRSENGRPVLGTVEPRAPSTHW